MSECGWIFAPLSDVAAVLERMVLAQPDCRAALPWRSPSPALIQAVCPLSLCGSPILLPWGTFSGSRSDAAIGFISRHWAWCVAVSLPVGYLSSTTHAAPDGILASLSIDFPPVLLATSLGFRSRRSSCAGMRHGLLPVDRGFFIRRIDRLIFTTEKRSVKNLIFEQIQPGLGHPVFPANRFALALR